MDLIQRSPTEIVAIEYPDRMLLLDLQSILPQFDSQGIFLPFPKILFLAYY